MARDIEQELDELKRQIDDIKKVLAVKLLESRQEQKPASVENPRTTRNAEQDPAVRDMLDRMEYASSNEGESGRVLTYLGVFSNGDQRYKWMQSKVNTDELFLLIESRAAEKVLSCIGSNERLNIISTLLKEPMTVAALVEKCGYNTTGQVYHHLKPLIAANIVSEDKGASKGTYFVRPQQVRGIIMLLAGVHDMVASE